jgi:hypothetical protein
MAGREGPFLREGKETVEDAVPALLKSCLANKEPVSKARHLVASSMNEWGASTLHPGSTSDADLAHTKYPFFLHTLSTGLMPPFSPFFCAILEHYQIQPLHLQPNSIVILAIFAFFCKAFLGVEPSMELFCLFYSLCITAGDQRSGCVSFLFGVGMTTSIIPIKLSKKVEDFRKRWLYIDTRQASPIFLPPIAIAVKNSGWEQ